MSEITFLPSQRGGKIVVHDNNMYHMQKESKGKSFWRCARKSCHSRLCLINDMLVSKTNFHNHEPPKKAIIRKSFTEKIKKRIETEVTVAVPTLYKEELGEAATSQDIAAHLPEYHNIEQSLYRKRNLTRPPIPKSLKEVILTEEFQKTKKGEDFLLCDDGTGEQRILIFSSYADMKRLCTVPNIFLDGTFKIVPKFIRQLYTIHGEYKGQVFPFVYCLLPDKEKITYRRVFKCIKYAAANMGLDFKPKLATVDFEMAAIKALEDEFPAIMVKGCFFHFTQAIWRKVQELGFSRQYRSDPLYKTWIRRLAALPLVPEDDVEEAFDLIQEEAPTSTTNANTLHNYVSETYVDLPFSGPPPTQGAMFSMCIWNHFSNMGARTTNNVEGFHSVINRRAGRRNLNFFSLVDLLQKLQRENEAAMLMLECGAKPKTQRKKYSTQNQNLNSLKDKKLRDEIDLKEYMDAASRFVKL